MRTERITTYAALLTAVTRLTDNAMNRAAIPLADLSEPDAEEVARLAGRIKVIGSADVNQEVDRMAALFGRFNADLFLAQTYHGYLRREEKGDDGKAIAQRVALGGIADELRTVLRDLERAIRKDIGA